MSMEEQILEAAPGASSSGLTKALRHSISGRQGLFRNRLWSYLFEDMNRAIDEIYLMCELECDMEQVVCALSTLNSAVLDFESLVKRIQDLQKFEADKDGGGGKGARSIAWQVRCPSLRSSGDKQLFSPEELLKVRRWRSSPSALSAMEEGSATHAPQDAPTREDTACAGAQSGTQAMAESNMPPVAGLAADHRPRETLQAEAANGSLSSLDRRSPPASPSTRGRANDSASMKGSSDGSTNASSNVREHSDRSHITTSDTKGSTDEGIVAPAKRPHQAHPDGQVASPRVSSAPPAACQTVPNGVTAASSAGGGVSRSGGRGEGPGAAGGTAGAPICPSTDGTHGRASSTRGTPAHAESTPVDPLTKSLSLPLGVITPAKLAILKASGGSATPGTTPRASPAWQEKRDWANILGAELAHGTVPPSRTLSAPVALSSPRVTSRACSGDKPGTNGPRPRARERAPDVDGGGTEASRGDQGQDKGGEGGRDASWRREVALHARLLLPEKKKKTPLETKRAVDEKQARATLLRRQRDAERQARHQRMADRLRDISERQALQEMRVRQAIREKEARSGARHEAHLASISRKAGLESTKVSEVHFITSLVNENKKLSLQQKLEDGEARRLEQLAALRQRQREDSAREEAAQERRRQLEEERRARLEENQRKKEAARIKREEEKRLVLAAREARSEQQSKRLEERQRALAEETEGMRRRLQERLLESAKRRAIYLEQIKEKTAGDADKQDKRRDVDTFPASPQALSPDLAAGLAAAASPSTVPGRGAVSSRPTTPTNAGPEGGSVAGGSASPGGLLLSAGKSDAKAAREKALRKRAKKLQRRLQHHPCAFVEPPGLEDAIRKVATARLSRACKLAATLGALFPILQEPRDRAVVATARGGGECSGQADAQRQFDKVVEDLVKVVEQLPGEEGLLHALRRDGVLTVVVRVLQMAAAQQHQGDSPGWPTPTGIAALLALLQLMLRAPANRHFLLCDNCLTPLISCLSNALATAITSPTTPTSASSNAAYSGSPAPSTQAVVTPDGGKSATRQDTSGASSAERSPRAPAVTAAASAPPPSSTWMGLLPVTIAVLGHKTVAGSDLRRVQGDLAELVAATGVLDRLCDLFLVFDRPVADAAPISGLVEQGLLLLETVTTSSLDECGILWAEPPSKSKAQGPSPANSKAQPDTSATPPDTHADAPMCNGSKGSSGDAGCAAACASQGGSLAGRRTNSSTNMVVAAAVAAAKVAAASPSHLVIRPRPHASASNQAVLAAMRANSLVGLTSLLTSVLLHSTHGRVCPDLDASEPPCYILPSNFILVATSVLHVLNNTARMDLALVQEMLALPDLKVEFHHLVSFLLSYCTAEWERTNRADVKALLNEVLLLVGYFSVQCPHNQAVLHWGKSPTILQKLCAVPFPYFTDTALVEVLFPTILAASFGNVRNREVLAQEMSLTLVSDCLRRAEERASKAAQVASGASADGAVTDGSASTAGGADRFHLEKRFPCPLWKDAAIFFSR
eukprot:jgi/Mesvir1/24918/Mv16903-RA.1